VIPFADIWTGSTDF